MTSTVGQAHHDSGRPFEFAPAFDLNLFVSRYGGVAGLKFKAGAALYSQGEPGDCLFYLQEGQAQHTVVSATGREAIFSLVGPGDFCGVGAVIGEPFRVSNATCKTDCVVARLERSSVVRAVQSDPQFAEFYLVYILNRTIRIRENLISQIFDSSERRLARTLLRLANLGQDGREEAVISKLDQEILAQMVGTTRSRVNHFMNKFRKLGYIDYSDRIAVHRSLSNILRHDCPSSSIEGRNRSP